VARRNPRLERRLISASLWRRRGTASLAVLAVAIGASVAAALLHLSGDVGRKLSQELRALGPDLLLVPAGFEDAGASALAAPVDYLDEAAVRRHLADMYARGACLLFLSARAEVAGRMIEIPVIGADMAELHWLHPGWRIGPGDARTLIGARLKARLGDAARGPVTLNCEGRTLTVPPGATLDAGGPDDDAWWVPLADAQRLADRPNRVSLVQMRLGGRNVVPVKVDRVRRAPPAPGMKFVVLHALTETESGLLERMRRLMALVTAAALIAAGLCAFGTLTDLALERRRDIALLKALGASRTDVVRLFATESLVLGALGGLIGWLIGVCFAEFIGRTVFHSAIALNPMVPLVVLALSIAVAAVAGLGPIRLALRVEPARALRGD